MAPAVNTCLPTVGTAYSQFRRSAKKHWEPNPFSSGGIRVKKQLQAGLAVIYSYNNYN